MIDERSSKSNFAPRESSASFSTGPSHEASMPSMMWPEAS